MCILQPFDYIWLVAFCYRHLTPAGRRAPSPAGRTGRAMAEAERADAERRATTAGGCIVTTGR